jgi:hypothetical protein
MRKQSCELSMDADAPKKYRNLEETGGQAADSKTLEDEHQVPIVGCGPEKQPKVSKLAHSSSNYNFPYSQKKENPYPLQ